MDPRGADVATEINSHLDINIDDYAYDIEHAGTPPVASVASELAVDASPAPPDVPQAGPSSYISVRKPYRVKCASCSLHIAAHSSPSRFS